VKQKSEDRYRYLSTLMPKRRSLPSKRLMMGMCLYFGAKEKKFTGSISILLSFVAICNFEIWSVTAERMHI
jgi:hypothetical protein